jgi:formylglycine-generating enzyme required for sulfatase activity
MAGNVWEWTSSLYKPYPYRADDGREAPNASGDRVVRGGSWALARRLARAAARRWYAPGLRYYLVGFRVVVAEPLNR